jgi:PleD family two-component response regulator
VTASVGVAVRRPGERFDDLVARADEALYRAKVGGRDRLDVAP